jgi:S-adenosylmethionine:tRNA ribosyltransferase-isomerase
MHRLTGTVYPGEGWTSLVIKPEHELKVIDGMLTGFHEPASSHLWMLLALAGYKHLQQAYHLAISKGYLWHEFGDLHLIVP